MKVMLLAAGKGLRMLPLTATTPKPLLVAGQHSLIEHQILKLAAAGFSEFVINHAWLGAQIETALGDGSKLGVSIEYSAEAQPLETAGGIKNALPLLGNEPFAVVNADIWTDYPFEQLLNVLGKDCSAHLVLVNNPAHHQGGDFLLGNDARVNLANERAQASTFSGIAVYRPEMFSGVTEPIYPLRPLLERYIKAGHVSGELYQGQWEDIGTVERLRALDLRLKSKVAD